MQTKEVAAFAAIFLLLVVSTPTQAATPSAPAVTKELSLSDLVEFCTSTDLVANTACKFFIFGVSQGARVVDAAVLDARGVAVEAPKASRRICFPDDTSSSAIEFVIKSAVAQDLMFYPADRDLPAASFIAAILYKKFGCKQQTTP